LPAGFWAVAVVTSLALAAVAARADDAPAAAPPPAAPARDRPTFTAPTDGPAAAIAHDLTAIHAEPDAAKQRAAIFALFRGSRDALFALETGALAALAPDVLRVYDLAGALASGGDGELPPWWSFADVPEATWTLPEATWTLPEPTPTAAVVRRATRIAGAVADRVKPPTIAAPTFVDVGVPSAARHDPRLAHACVVVLGGPDDLARAEAVLDRVATTGGPSHVVTIDVLRSEALARALGAADLAPGSARDVSGATLPDAAARAAARVASFTLPAPFGRRATSSRSVESAYVKDVDVELGNGTATPAPIVGLLPEGLGATALVERAADGNDRVALAIRWLDARRPLLTFRTSLAAAPVAAKDPVVIEIPELRFARAAAALQLVGRPTRHVVRIGPPDTFALVETTPAGPATPTARGWTRVGPDTPPAGITDARRVEVEFETWSPGAAAPVRGGLSMLPGQEVSMSRIEGPPDGAALATGSEVTVRTGAPSPDGRRTFDVVVRSRLADADPRRFAWQPSQHREAELRTVREVVRPYRFRLAPGERAVASGADGTPAVALRYAHGPAYAAPSIVLVAPTPGAVEPRLPPPGTVPPAGLRPAPPPPPTRPSDDALAAVRAAKGAEQLRAIEALRASSQDGFLELTSAALAALAPDVLRVYDLSAALADGGDAETPPAFDLAAPPPSMAPWASPTASNELRRATRLADALAQAMAQGIDGPSFALVRRGPIDVGPSFPLLVVLGTKAQLADAERALDRLATTGGPVVRLEVDVLRPTANPAGSGDIERLARYEFDVPYNRPVAAWRRVRHAYLQDADARAGEGPVSPIVGTWAEGIGLIASVGEGAHMQDPQVHLAFAMGVGSDRVSTFSTTLAGSSSPVTIELPEVRQQQVNMAWLVPATGLIASESIFQAEVAVEVKARRVTPSAPIGRGWVRVAPGAAVAARPTVRAVSWSAHWKDAHGKTLTLPRMTVYEAQTATVSVLDQRAYIAGVDVVGSDGAWIADPVIGTLLDGVVIEATARPTADGAFVLEGRCLVVGVDDPIRERRWGLGVGTPITLQLPVAREASRPFRVRLAVGASAEVAVPWLPRGDGEANATLELRIDGVEMIAAPPPAK